MKLRGRDDVVLLNKGLKVPPDKKKIYQVELDLPPKKNKDRVII